MGVEIHFNVSFESLVEPTKTTGWRVKLSPADHPLDQLDFDVIVGADGRHSTLPEFSFKKSKGNKLGIAITVNFVNNFSEAEKSVSEQPGLSYIYNQEFFLGLKNSKEIDLENIVYYKDDTHYFVMTAKKWSLQKGVFLKR